MSRYSAYKKRKENASPYAAHAVCRKCVHCTNVRAALFCYGFDKIKKIPASANPDKEGYCTQYYPKGE